MTVRMVLSDGTSVPVDVPAEPWALPLALETLAVRHGIRGWATTPLPDSGEPPRLAGWAVVPGRIPPAELEPVVGWALSILGVDRVQACDAGVSLRQRRAQGDGRVVEIEVGGRRYVAKAELPSIAREARLLPVLGSLADGFTPSVVGADPDRGFLLEVAVDGVPLAEARDVARPALLALETVAHVAACVDPRAALDAGALDGRPAALSAWLEGPDAAACLGDAWGVVRDRMDDAFRRLEEDAPVAVVHGDLHPWNVYLRSAAGEPRCVLIDWGRAAVGHPALDVATVLLAATARERATAMEEIRRRIPAAILGAALDVGLLLQLVGSVELLGALPPADAWQREREVIGWARRLALHAAHRGDR